MESFLAIGQIKCAAQAKNMRRTGQIEMRRAGQKLAITQEALSICNKALLLEPDYAPLRLTSGEAYKKLGKAKNASDEFEKALALTNKLPSSEKDLIQLAVCHLGLGHLKQSIEFLTEAVELEPNNFFTYYYRAEAYRQLGKTDLASQDLEQVKHLQKEFLLKGASDMRAMGQIISY